MLSTITARLSSRLRLQGDAPEARIVSGSLTMLIGSGLVSLVNLLYNVGIARLLGPVAFGEVAAVYTLLMLISAVTLSFQLVCAKFVAKNETLGAKAAVYRSLHRRAWKVGLAIAAVLALTSRATATYLNLSSPLLLILLGIGIAFYIPLGVRRGAMQGVYKFRRLAANFVLEGVVKLGGAFLLIRLDQGVVGAIAAVAASVMLAYIFGRPGRELHTEPEPGFPASFDEGIQAIVFFVGQVIINNVDIVLVKHFFAAEPAGLYAAAALVGRVLYMLSWSVVSAMFPISAGIRGQERDDRAVLVPPLIIVLLITAAFTLALWLFPGVVWQAVFGHAFQHRDMSFYSSLLVLYAGATGVYSLCVVLITYEMSRKIANTAWLQLAFSGTIVLGIFWFHSTLHQVRIVQLVALLLLLVTVSKPFLHARLRRRGELALVPALVTMRKLRLLSQNEVIAEFLKNEFYHDEFRGERAKFQHLVDAPDLSNPAENAFRRALLFRRRGGLWRELPSDTQWWEVELETADIDRMRFFPRANWRKISRGRFDVNEIVQRIRESGNKKLDRHFVSKLETTGCELQQRDERVGSILLIAENETSPLTIIEGNHRVAAALLVSPDLLQQRFRILCGFSPRMIECCWYRTNLANLLRYARNKVRRGSSAQDLEIDGVAATQAGATAI